MYLKWCNIFSLSEHAFTQNTSSPELCIIVPSSVLHSGIFVTVEWRKLFLAIFISCTAWFFSHHGWGNFLSFDLMENESVCHEQIGLIRVSWLPGALHYCTCDVMLRLMTFSGIMIKRGVLLESSKRHWSHKAKLWNLLRRRQNKLWKKFKPWLISANQEKSTGLKNSSGLLVLKII